MSDDEAEMRRMRASRGFQKSSAARGSESKYGSSDSSNKKRNATDMEMDMAAMMGFSGFGQKQSAKPKVPKMDSFDKFGRDEIIERLKQEQKAADEKNAQKKQEFEKAEAEREKQKKTNSQSKKSKKDKKDKKDNIRKKSKKSKSEKIQKHDSSESDDDDDDDDDNDDNEIDDLARRFPVSHSIILDHGDKMISSLSLDPNGSRLISGGYDFTLKFWDFAGMNKSLHSFRKSVPVENHQIQSANWSITGDRVLCVVANSTAMILDRDGTKLETCAKGDPYINDKAKTKGHVGFLYGGVWHPKEHNKFLTYGIDSTVRLWNAENLLSQSQVYKVKNKAGRPVHITSACFELTGKNLASATATGGIYVYKCGSTSRPVLSQHVAHDQDISSIAYSSDGRNIISRSMDDTMKIWDVRQFSKPLHIFNDLENAFPDTDCLFSPDEKAIVTGTSVRRGQGNGRVCFFDRTTFKKIHEDAIEGASATSFVWHPKLNQIFIGTGDGKIKILFSPKYSLKGAKLFASKSTHKTHGLAKSDPTKVVVQTPHALPLFEDKGRTTRKQRERLAKDPKIAAIPERNAPLQVTQNWAAHIKEQVDKDTTRDEDPRDALLRLKDITEAEPLYVSNAYKETQPDKILAEKVEFSDEED